MPAWSTIASLATAGGTLVLAIVTVASVRSANRAARVAERSLLAGLRPLLVPTRPQDPEQKVLFGDIHWVKVAGGRAVAEVTEKAVYLTISLRNVGTGIAVLHGWLMRPEAFRGGSERPQLSAFRLQQRDLYISPGDAGFWQGALRDPTAPEFMAARKVIDNGEPFTIDLLYGDLEGGQRIISRFTITSAQSDAWWASATRHWNVDSAGPR